MPDHLNKKKKKSFSVRMRVTDGGGDRTFTTEVIAESDADAAIAALRKHTDATVVSISSG